MIRCGGAALGGASDDNGISLFVVDFANHPSVKR